MYTVKTVILEALEISGKLIKKNINKINQVSYKGDIDLVTLIDKKVENNIIKLIKKQFPNDLILAEESGVNPPKAKNSINARWIIDPIDGTTNFFHSFPQVCTSIAYEKNNKIQLAGVYNPIRDELFFAELNKGAKLNGKKIKVSNNKKLKDSLLTTGFPYDRRQYADYYLSFFKAFMMQSHGIRRVGSAALDLCYVACGRIDGFWEFKLKPWDVAAGSLILKEAGGKITDFNTNKYPLTAEETLATNSLIHKEMRNTILKHIKPDLCF